MRALGLELQTMFGMPPLEHVRLAAELGCRHISTGLTPVPWQLDCFPDWSLRSDKKLQRELRAALQDSGVVIALAEGFAIRAARDVRSCEADLDIMTELGAEAVSTVCLDTDQARSEDQFAALWEMVSARGLHLRLEFAPPHTVNTLEKARNLVATVGEGQATLVLDAMHFFRSGSTLKDLAVLPPQLIGYAQICDTTLAQTEGEDYYHDACFNRMLPGTGELPLREFVQNLPSHIPLGIEVPLRSRLTSAEDIRQIAAESVAQIKQWI